MPTWRRSGPAGIRFATGTSSPMPPCTRTCSASPSSCGVGLPEMPELEDDAWAVVAAGPYRWRCDAARQVENFTDFGHFPWVHPGLLGDPDRPVVPRHEVRTEGHVLHYSIIRPEAPNTDD